MKQGTMNILFFVLKTKLLKNGEAPILMRITINGQYEEIRIQRSVPLKNWNPARGCSKGKDRASIELNNYISALTTRAYEKHKELTFESALIYNPQIEMFARFKMKSSFHKTKRII